MASVSFKYWDDCVDTQDLEAMWAQPDVRAEWIEVGETKGAKVHLSRDPDGHPYLTQTEMRAVAGIIVQRHFVSQIDSDMLCAIAELETDRQPLATRYNKKTKETILGIMQVSPKTAEWLVSDLNCRTYHVDDLKSLYKPFVNVYLAAAYLKWLSNFDQKERSEEFMIRAYKGGVKKATHKSTLPYWKKYLSVKESLPSRRIFGAGAVPILPPGSVVAEASADAIPTKTTWDSRTSPEDMEEMWNDPNVNREWTKSGEKKGKVRFSHDTDRRPYLSRVELKALAEIILRKHFSTRGVKPTVLCAIAEMVNMRFVNGISQRTGLLGIDFSTACWLYKNGYQGYTVESVEDLTNPFVSMYFGAAYMAWLSDYEGRERTPEFVVQAYLSGPQNVNLQEASPIWTKFQEALNRYEDHKGHGNASCIIL